MLPARAEAPYAGKCGRCGRDCVWWDDAAVCLGCRGIEDDCECPKTGAKILDSFMAGD